MACVLGEVAFDEWVGRIFDREITYPEWYHRSLPEDEELRGWDTDDPVTAVRYVTRLFDEPMHWLSGFSKRQLSQGLWYLGSNACSNYMFAVTNEAVDWAERRRCVESFYSLYEKLFMPLCAPRLAHLFPARRDARQEREQQLHERMMELYRKYFPEAPAVELPQKVMGERIRRWTAERDPLVKELEAVQASAVPWEPYPLNTVCYMWWDIVPIYGSRETEGGEALSGVVLKVLERTLELESVACQEGALHGLGHWGEHCRAETAAIVDRYVERARPSAALLAYARQAKAGCIL